MPESTAHAASGLDDPDEQIRLARAALDRHEWQAAFDHLSAGSLTAPLSGPDLEMQAVAAFFSARADLALEIKERAFLAHQRDGDELRAAYLAVDIAREYGYAGKASIASAWTGRAIRILGEGGDSYAHGYLALVRSEAAAARGDIDEALALAERAAELGDRASHPDLRASALSNLGELKIATGSAADGFALMEEASISAVNGELSPFTTGVTACRMIGACRNLTDYRRASEWIEATERYCERNSLSGFPGVCRIHRAEVAAVGGAWDRAEEELERATAELSAYNATPPQADGFYAIGDIRRLRGDFEGAEAALREAHARGRSPQPALALIRLAEGKVRVANAAIDAALREETWDRWSRARLLPAKVEIAIAANDAPAARAAAEELGAIVADYPSPALEAGRQAALGRVLLAEGDPVGAARELRAAIRGWREVGSPYEIARVRALLSSALRTVDEETSDLELRAALDELQRLGARPEADQLERVLQDVLERRDGPVTARMTFMFTDIVGSTNLAEALGDLAWERLLRSHDDILRGLVATGGGEIVKSTGDGIFAAFATAATGVGCAISIQRALREHRDESGVALAVRIGLHTADANRRGADYSGKGVHVAARVAALAGAGQILVTDDTVAESPGLEVTDRRSAMVKGVSTAVGLATVAWD